MDSKLGKNMELTKKADLESVNKIVGISYENGSCLEVLMTKNERNVNRTI